MATEGVGMRYFINIEVDDENIDNDALIMRMAQEIGKTIRFDPYEARIVAVGRVNGDN